MLLIQLLTIQIILLCDLTHSSPAEFFTLGVPNNKVLEEVANPKPRPCICVPYWQCNEDFTGLIDDGADIIDIRMSKDTVKKQMIQECSGDFDVCCQVQCGKLNNGFNRKEHVQSRILKEANDADFAEFPWMLGVLQGETFKCGASLIHPQVALTAAHCVLPNTTYTIRAGEWNWEAKTEPLPHQDRNTREIIIHPHYHARSLRNDIALIILETPFQLAENIGVVCLPKQPTQTDAKQQTCIATGWGKNSFKKGTYQTTLKKVMLPIVPRDVCVRSLRNARLGPYFHLHRSFMCAGGEKNRDTCKGDGGSPLVCAQSGEPDRFEQVGIVSWGLTCGVQNTPGVYVDVAGFSDWIDDALVARHFDILVYRR